jgi:hypothetical protein
MSEKANRLGKSEVQKFTHPKLVIVIAILAIALMPIGFLFATEPAEKNLHKFSLSTRLANFSTVSFVRLAMELI